MVGLIVAIITGLWTMPLGFGLLAAQHGKPAAVNIAETVFTVFALGWLVLPMLTFGLDETLDPARLMLLPLRPVTMARGLFAAALTGIGPVVTFVILLGAVVAVASGPGSALVGVLAVAINLCLCVAGSRALTTSLSGLLRSRRGRDLGVLVGAVLSLTIFSADLAFQRSLITSASRGGISLGGDLTATARVVRWTPPGWTAHAIADAAAGRYGSAAIELGASAVVVAVLIFAWIAALRRALENADASTSVRPRQRGLATTRMRPRPAQAGAPSLAGTVPPAGSVSLARMASVAWPWPERAWVSRSLNTASRELRYYRRDPRRKQQLVSLAMPVILILVNSQVVPGRAGQSGPVHGLPTWPAVLGGILAGMFSTTNQFGMDGSALWMNVVATSSWRDLRADMAGKSLAGASITVPVFAVLYAVLGWLTGNPAAAAGAFGIVLCAVGATSAVASVVSVLMPVPVPERRASAFSGGGAGQGCLAGLTTLGGLLVSLILMIPLLVFQAAAQPGGWLLVIAPCYGALLAWAGRWVAAEVGYRRLPEVLAAVSRAL
jgi:ABC-2 type transport system permease protein